MGNILEVFGLAGGFIGEETRPGRFNSKNPASGITSPGLYSVAGGLI